MLDDPAATMMNRGRYCRCQDTKKQHRQRRLCFLPSFQRYSRRNTAFFSLTLFFVRCIANLLARLINSPFIARRVQPPPKFQYSNKTSACPQAAPYLSQRTAHGLVEVALILGRPRAEVTRTGRSSERRYLRHITYVLSIALPTKPSRSLS